MGDEHGTKVLALFYPCEEPSAAARLDFLRPAAACRRGEFRRLRGAFQHDQFNRYRSYRAACQSMRIFPIFLFSRMRVKAALASPGG